MRVVVTDGTTLLGSALARLHPDHVASGHDAGALIRDLRPDLVYACSGRSGGIDLNQRAPATLMMDNLAHIVAIFGAAREAGVKRLLYFASSCCYPRDARQPMREEDLFTGPVEPTSRAYATAKQAGIRMCEAMSREAGVDYKAVIPADVYGPGDDLDPASSHVVVGMMVRMLEAKREGAPTFTVWGSGRPERDFLYVDDLAAAAGVLATAPHMDVVNIGSGRGTSVAELAHTLQRVVGYDGALVFDMTRPDGMPLKRLDTSRMDALGWKPSVSLEEGIARTMQWYLSR